MSLGLPTHLAPQVVRRSFVRAQHTVAFTLLVVALFVTLVLQSAQPDAVLWPAALALLPAMGFLLLRTYLRATVWSVGYLVVGGLGTYLYVMVILGQSIPITENDGFSFLAVRVALIMVGGAVLGVGAGIAWACAGFAVAVTAVGLAQFQLGRPVTVDLPTVAVLLATIALIPLVGFNSRRQRRAQPLLHRAAQDEQVATLRYRIEVKAATLMHDTVLNHLAAIADSSEEVLDPALRRQVMNDVKSLAGEEWLAEPADTVSERTRLDWQHSGLFTAIQEGRLLGLDVETTGDLAAVGRLEREESIALGLAVKQCLVNVLKHSGTTHAEVAVYGSESTLSVMVVDTGCGFTEAATGSDRLGLRSSVRKRIELVGGQVSVWSTPGRGTSIMIKIPVREAVAGVAAESAEESR